MSLPDQSTDNPSYTASDIRKTAGLSYRQLNDWDTKGALPGTRPGDSSWRKFTLREVFAILVCVEIRDRFGVPLHSLKWVQSCMLRDGADHFTYAVRAIASLGVSLYLLTDLKETFIIDHDHEFEDMFRLGYFRGDNPRAYIFIKLNPLVNRVLACLKKPIELKTHDKFYELLRYFELDRIAKNKKEQEVLRLLREKTYQRITVQTKNGEILHADVEEESFPERHSEIVDAVESNAYQTVTVKVQDGKVVHLSRKHRIKLNTVTGRT